MSKPKKSSPRAVQTDRAPAPVGPYSQAVATGRWVFASGQIPLGPDGVLVQGDIEAQTEQVLTNLAAVLEAAGGSLANVVKTTVYLIDLAEFPRMNETYARHFTGDPAPARATVAVSALPLGARVEIDAVARL
jgi:2-iminobutanoate/2-iminopropanoate deaminase